MRCIDNRNLGFGSGGIVFGLAILRNDFAERSPIPRRFRPIPNHAPGRRFPSRGFRGRASGCHSSPSPHSIYELKPPGLSSGVITYLEDRQRDLRPHVWGG